MTTTQGHTTPPAPKTLSASELIDLIPDWDTGISLIVEMERKFKVSGGMPFRRTDIQVNGVEDGEVTDEEFEAIQDTWYWNHLGDAMIEAGWNALPSIDRNADGTFEVCEP